MNVSNMLVKFEKDQLHIKLAILDQTNKIGKIGFKFTPPLIKGGWSCLFYHRIGKNQGLNLYIKHVCPILRSRNIPILVNRPLITVVYP